MRRTITLIGMLMMLLQMAVAQEVRLPRVATDSAWSASVKSVYLTRDGIELSPPVLTLGGESRLYLSFDLLEEEPADLRYRIVHCDREWHPDLPDTYDYMQGFEEDNLNDYESSFTTRQPYFHYHVALPAQGSRLTASGNYAVIVFLQEQPDSVLLTRRFWVVEPLVELSAQLVKPMEGNMMTDQEVDVALQLKEGQLLSLQPQYVTVQVRQNQRIDNLRTLPFAGYEGQVLQYRWRRENVFAGGNIFRYFDISNLRSAMYNVVQTDLYGGEYYSVLRPLEDRSRKAYIFENTLNGGMKTNAFDRSNPTLMAEYVWVNFSLPMERPLLDGAPHIVGALTDWRLDEASRMEWRPEYKAYTKRLLLKQGYYAYQILFKEVGRAEGTFRLEGSHYATPNEYTIYVYYRYPNDLSDRLIGFTVL